MTRQQKTLRLPTKRTLHLKENTGGAGQDGGVGRNPSLPPTTKRRITTSPKSINHQNHQKIKLHETPTTEELKKKSIRTTRPVRWQTVLAR